MTVYGEALKDKIKVHDSYSNLIETSIARVGNFEKAYEVSGLQNRTAF